MKRSTIHRVAVAALAAALTMPFFCAPALGVTSSYIRAQLEEAQERQEALSMEAAAAGERLNDTKYQLEQTEEQIVQTNADIEAKERELDEAQRVLSNRVSATYKTGGISLVSILLESENLDELVSNIYYADKVTQHDSEAIQHVKAVRSELEEKRESLGELEAEQTELVEQQQRQVDELKEAEAAQSDYVNSLSLELQQKLEEERLAEIARQEAARKAAEEARRKAEEEAARKAAEEEAARRLQEQEQQGEDDSAPGTQEGGSAADTDSSGGGSSAPAATSDVRQTIVNAAYSQLGVGYSYGASSPGVAFDCSGLTSWCYAQAGISIPHSSAGQAGYIRSTSNLQPGDLVIWLGGVNSGSGNHVALYVGNGQIIHANGSYVTLDSLSRVSGYTMAGSVL